MSELLADLLITVLFGTSASFTHPGVILPAKESLGDLELKTIVRKSQRNKAEREVLAYSPRVWKALTETLQSGNEQLEENKHNLLPKIADLASLGRNLLVAKEKAQNLCAEGEFDAEIRRLIEICIEKTSKPISPNLEKGHHEKEMKIKHAYKKVLVTCLQFLNNLITFNDERKLHLWMHLFGSPTATLEADSDGGDDGDDGPDDLDELAVEDINLNTNPILPPANSVKPTVKQSQRTAEQISNHDALASLPGSVYSSFATLSDSFNYSYYNPGFLTDIPRILGPSEIEALPMILHNGIAPIEGTDINMQSVRCNILLAQESGRALLRELLVFLGAWEVEERDFCYKMMQQIIEAILRNGLIPFAYEAFKDDKDIITPAQCVLLKLLVSLYRAPLPSADSPEPPIPSKIIPSMTLIPLRLKGQPFMSSKYMWAAYPNTPPARLSPIKDAAPQLLDTSIAAYLIRVFRLDVLPNIRRIILQQGAIKSGEMKRENFEWSLWDLDRVYEGLYQFMEMMVVFAEDDGAKTIMLEGVKEAVAGMKFKGDVDINAPTDSSNPTNSKPTDKGSKQKQEKEEQEQEQEYETGGLVSELVCFLVEMDRIIPRYLQTKPNQPQTQAQTQTAAHYPNPPPSSAPSTSTSNPPPPPLSTSSTTTTTTPHLIERPYDPPPSLSSSTSTSSHAHTITTHSTPPTPPPRSPSPGASSTSSLDPDSTLTDPEDFTWPHMKKFCVLLLSNLSWKNNDVKDLVRERGGLAAVLNQTMVDDDNPYIREYAILCIRNLLEGNMRNQKVVGGLEKAKKAAEQESAEGMGAGAGATKGEK